MHGTTQAVEASEEKRLPVKFRSGLVQRFNERTIKLLCHFARGSCKMQEKCFEYGYVASICEI